MDKSEGAPLSQGAKIDHINKYLFIGTPLILERDGVSLTVGCISIEGWTFPQCAFDMPTPHTTLYGGEKPSGSVLLTEQEVDALYAVVTQEIGFGIGRPTGGRRNDGGRLQPEVGRRRVGVDRMLLQTEQQIEEQWGRGWEYHLIGSGKRLRAALIAQLGEGWLHEHKARIVPKDAVLQSAYVEASLESEDGRPFYLRNHAGYEDRWPPDWHLSGRARNGKWFFTQLCEEADLFPQLEDCLNR